MFANYIRVALRNLFKYKTYSLITILGMTIGISACLVIFSYIKTEISFDTCYADSDRIYRIGTIIKDKTGEATFATAHVPVAAFLKDNFPQVENAVRFCGGPPQVVRLDNHQSFYEKENYFRVDADFFEVFNIPFIDGNPQAIFNQSRAVVISEALANKYFGNRNPVGRTINFDKKDWAITGVFENLPHNSHLPPFQIVTLLDFPKWASGWDGLRVPTYIKIQAKSNIKQLDEQLVNLGRKYDVDDTDRPDETRRYFLQPVEDIHLHSDFLQEYANLGSTRIIYIFSVLGFVILFIASLNYINLTTARLINRSKEIGIRKIIGADRGQIFRQFLGESSLYILISIIFAIILSEILVPVLNRHTGSDIDITYFADFSFILLIILLMFIIGILSGFYPAFIISLFSPVKIINQASRKKGIRNFLIIFQFTISAILIIGTFFFYQQLYFMKNKDLGFNKEHMLVLPMQDQEMMQKVSAHSQSLKQEFTRHHSVISATAILRTPGRIEHHDNIELIEGNNSKTLGMNNIFVDHDFINTYDIKIVAGRVFKKDFSGDTGNAFIINESAVRAFGWQSAENAIGKQLSYWMGKGEIIGVCKDFHLWSLHRPIEPLFFLIPPRIFPEYITLKLNSVNPAETIGFLKEIWKVQFPDYPFEYYFLNDDFNRQYRSDEIFNEIILLFTGLAVFIACAGLFSLAALTIDQRTREIGIRKVLGSGVFGIMLLLNREFINLVIISALIACPVAYVVVYHWLRNFAFRIELNYLIFPLSCGLIILISILTICIRSLKAAFTNPVDELRYE